MNKTNNSKELTINYTNVELDRIVLSELKEGKNSKGQKNSYPTYNHRILGSDSPLIIQFPWLTLSTYGIPKIGEFTKSDSDRLYIKCPLDINEKVNKDLYENLINTLDDIIKLREHKIHGNFKKQPHQIRSMDKASP